ncbi:glycosyltransferase [Burkholderiales bacterium JOSHI_001]|nr:glycosyltransferase [Burkholderiales bacterium JOSHI_001]
MSRLTENGGLLPPAKIWLLAVGEPLPTDPGTPRLLRAGLLASQMAASGLQVTWWTSAFDHTQKRTRPDTAARPATPLPYALQLLRGDPYRSNVSMARIRNHRQVAADFAQRAPSETAPDLIFAAYPTIELCEAALAYAKPRRIPVVLDMRDLWPDIFVNLGPGWAQPLARQLLKPMMRASHRACAGATAITGITEAFVDWGVARAGRQRHEWDQAYPLAYHARLPDAAALASARAQWDARGLGANQPMVCFFGTLGRQFDIPGLIAAARLVADTPLQMVICGTGDRLDEYRQLAADLPRVHFPGWVDAAAINALMERSLAGLAPYHSEMSFTMSLPNKAIEYLAGGLPVLSTLRGELQTLLRTCGCGITTAEGDPQALAGALRVLLADTQGRAKMADNARLTYKTQFVAETVYGRLIKHLGLIAMQHRQGRTPGAIAARPPGMS